MKYGGDTSTWWYLPAKKWPNSWANNIAMSGSENTQPVASSANRRGRIPEHHSGADVEGRREGEGHQEEREAPLRMSALHRVALACALPKRTICYSPQRMDLYSAAKRLNRPFVFADEASRSALTIADHGLIGDGFSAALVRADGAIDWLCLPRFDSPSVFASLLDSENGRFTSVSPVDYPFESLQRYDPDTNVLETVFRIEGRGTIRLTDYMPWTDDPRSAVHEVHRRVQCVEGEAVVKVVFDPRFDYGRAATRFEIAGRSASAKGPADQRLVAVLGGVGEWEPRPEGGVQAVFRLKAGERGWVVISWNAAKSESILAYRPFEALRNTRRRWRDWVQQLQYDGPWRHHVVRSALLLKLLMYAPTGAMVAAPTTSLPEWIGGVRNWDYRYTWTRDTAMAVRAANLLGCNREAREFFHFVRDTLERDRELHIMYAVDGGRVPDEQTLDNFVRVPRVAPGAHRKRRS